MTSTEPTSPYLRGGEVADEEPEEDGDQQAAEAEAVVDCVVQQPPLVL